MTGAPDRISAANFQFIQDFVYRRSGIVLEPDKQYLVESRLRPVVKQAGFASVAELCCLLRAPAARNASAAEAEVINALTTNETYFFREPAQYAALASVILPDLARRRRSSRAMRFWSAAASTGQEAYSLAMALHEAGLAAWDVQILGTDLNAAVIERARLARYSVQDLRRGLSDARIARFFLPLPDGKQEAQAALKRMARFETADLRHRLAPPGLFDVVMCRNVLIYFDQPTRQRVLAQIRDTLAPGGYLFLGAAETMTDASRRFHRVQLDGALAYQAE